MGMLLFGDPLCSALSMLAEEAIAEEQQQLNTVPKKPTKSIATNKVLKLEASNFKKPSDLCSKKPIKVADSAFEGSSTFSSPIHSHIKKITFRVGMMKTVVGEAKAEISSSSEKPIKVMDPANFEVEEEDDHVLRMKKGKGLKRTIIDAFINDGVVREWEVGESSSSKKMKKKEKKSELTKEQSKLLDEAVERAPTVLPPEFINKINEMGGTEITLVITKYLYKTDLSTQHMRLSMPLKQIKNNAGFLREGELQELEGGTIQVVLLQPSLELANLVLAKWYAKAKHDGTRNANYILRTNWMDVVKANDLQNYGIVQVWSFRVQEKLHMALVKLPNVIV